MSDPVRFVRDLMVTPVHTLRPDANVADLAELMDRERVRHVPIAEADGTLVGLATHRDMLAKALGGGSDLPSSIRRPYLESMPVADVMVTEVETAAPDADLAEAACQMVNRRHGCLPVVDEGGRVVGILTSQDFVRYVAGCS